MSSYKYYDTEDEQERQLWRDQTRKRHLINGLEDICKFRYSYQKERPREFGRSNEELFQEIIKGIKAELYDLRHIELDNS